MLKVGTIVPKIAKAVSIREMDSAVAVVLGTMVKIPCRVVSCSLWSTGLSGARLEAPIRPNSYL